MRLQALRQLALDTATAIDAEADAQKWPEIVNGLLRQLVQVAEAKGVEAKAFYNQLELPEDEPNVVLFESTDAPDLIGLSEATVTELEAWIWILPWPLGILSALNLSAIFLAKLLLLARELAMVGTRLRNPEVAVNPSPTTVVACLVAEDFSPCSVLPSIDPPPTFERTAPVPPMTAWASFRAAAAGDIGFA